MKNKEQQDITQLVEKSSAELHFPEYLSAPWTKLNAWDLRPRTLDWITVALTTELQIQMGESYELRLSTNCQKMIKKLLENFANSCSKVEKKLLVMKTNTKNIYLLFNVNLVASACRLMTSKMKRLCPMQPIISRFSDAKRAPTVLTGHPNRFISVVAPLLNFSGKEKLQPRRRLLEADRAHFSPLTLRYLLLFITPNKPRDALSITNLEQLQDRSP